MSGIIGMVVAAAIMASAVFVIIVGVQAERIDAARDHFIERCAKSESYMNCQRLWLQEMKP